MSNVMNQQKNDIIETIKLYCITDINQLEYRSNIQVHYVRTLMKEDPSFKDIIDKYMYQNLLKRKARDKAIMEEFQRKLEKRNGYELER